MLFAPVEGVHQKQRRDDLESPEGNELAFAHELAMDQDMAPILVAAALQLRHAMLSRSDCDG